jgi:hypothetical protein
MHGDMSHSCGTCSLCCKLYEVPEIAKPFDTWCRHCKPGKGGCSIYTSRPAVCRNFQCLWLQGWFGNGDRLDEMWKPSRSKMVALCYMKGAIPTIEIRVDPAYPNRWREQPYYAYIKEFSKPFYEKPEGGCLVIVVVGQKCFVITPTRDIERSVGKDETDLEEKWRMVEDEWRMMQAMGGMRSGARA